MSEIKAPIHFERMSEAELSEFAKAILDEITARHTPLRYAHTEELQAKPKQKKRGRPKKEHSILPQHLSKPTLPSSAKPTPKKCWKENPAAKKKEYIAGFAL